MLEISTILLKMENKSYLIWFRVWPVLFEHTSKSMISINMIENMSSINTIASMISINMIENMNGINTITSMSCMRMGSAM